MRRYLGSKLSGEHVIVAVGILLWITAAIWQLWIFGNRPEIIFAAILMGLAGGAIGYYLAVVNRVDSDKRDDNRRQFDD